MFRPVLTICALFALATIASKAPLAASAAPPMAANDPNVTRATLANGLKIIVVRDPLAPAVTAMLNYKAGGDEQTIPGQAHALEHMMFRGSPTLSQSQLADVTELLGGDADADTQPEVTQYFFTAPSQYLDLLIRMEASRSQGLSVAQSDWAIERGAIKNEVTQDESQPLAKLQLEMEPKLFEGSPYGNDVLGTIEDFDTNVNSPQLLAFYHKYYHPNNAIYVIVGDVDPKKTIALVSKYFGRLPAVPIPARPKSVLGPLTSQTLKVDSDQAESTIYLAYRFPGYRDKDYAAGQILEAALSNKRSDLYALVANGKASQVGLEDFETHPFSGAADAFIVVPTETKAADAIASLHGVLEAYRTNGVPADLVAAEKRRFLSAAEFKANSIEGLAYQWSQAVAVQGEASPDSGLAAIANVTVDDVDRVLRKYIDPAHELIGITVPKHEDGSTTSAAPAAPVGPENAITILHHDPLPTWATAAFAKPNVPPAPTTPVDTLLSNGARLIVIPQAISKTVVVRGSIQTSEGLQAPIGLDGIADVTAKMLDYGTATYDRLAFRKQLDAIAADVTTGTNFTLSVRSADFDRGVALLADGELHPAFPTTAFDAVKQEKLGAVKGDVASPDHARNVALNGALYPATDPLQRFATPETVAKISLDDVKAYYASVYRPDLATIVVVGNVDPAHAKAVFETAFADWKSVGPTPVVSLPAVPQNGNASIIVADPQKVQSQVQLAQVSSITSADPQFAALEVANASFGGTASSILFHDVRDVHGLVYGVYSSVRPAKNRTTFTIQYACDPGKIVAAQSLILNDLKSLSTTGLNQTDLLRGRTGLASAIPLRAASFDGIANELIRYAQLGLPLDQSRIEARNESIVTNADVIKAVNAWIRRSDFVRVIEGPGPT